MSEARRGELWLTDLGEPVGHEQGMTRPALVLSSDRWNRHARMLVVVPLTTRSYDLPTRIEVEPSRENGLDSTSYARCEDIRSISDRRLIHRLGGVDPIVMSSVGRTLRTFLEI